MFDLNTVWSRIDAWRPKYSFWRGPNSSAEVPKIDNLEKKEVQCEAIDRRNERENMREEKPSSDDSGMRDDSFSQPSSNNESSAQDGNRE